MEIPKTVSETTKDKKPDSSNSVDEIVNKSSPEVTKDVPSKEPEVEDTYSVFSYLNPFSYFGESEKSVAEKDSLEQKETKEHEETKEQENTLNITVTAPEKTKVKVDTYVKVEAKPDAEISKEEPAQSHSVLSYLTFGYFGNYPEAIDSPKEEQEIKNKEEYEKFIKKRMDEAIENFKKLNKEKELYLSTKELLQAKSLAIDIETHVKQGSLDRKLITTFQEITENPLNPELISKLTGNKNIMLEVASATKTGLPNQRKTIGILFESLKKYSQEKLYELTEISRLSENSIIATQMFSRLNLENKLRFIDKVIESNIANPSDRYSQLSLSFVNTVMKKNKHLFDKYPYQLLAHQENPITLAYRMLIGRSQLHQKTISDDVAVNQRKTVEKLAPLSPKTEINQSLASILNAKGKQQLFNMMKVSKPKYSECTKLSLGKELITQEIEKIKKIK